MCARDEYDERCRVNCGVAYSASRFCTTAIYTGETQSVVPILDAGQEGRGRVPDEHGLAQLSKSAPTSFSSNATPSPIPVSIYSIVPSIRSLTGRKGREEGRVPDEHGLAQLSKSAPTSDLHLRPDCTNFEPGFLEACSSPPPCRHTARRKLHTSPALPLAAAPKQQQQRSAPGEGFFQRK